ncbi:hypothetical protein SK128_000577, partial [Halocaridina rubra]
MEASSADRNIPVNADLRRHRQTDDDKNIGNSDMLEDKTNTEKGRNNTPLALETKLNNDKCNLKVINRPPAEVSNNETPNKGTHCGSRNPTISTNSRVPATCHESIESSEYIADTMNTNLFLDNSEQYKSCRTNALKPVDDKHFESKKGECINVSPGHTVHGLIDTVKSQVGCEVISNELGTDKSCTEKNKDNVELDRGCKNVQISRIENIKICYENLAPTTTPVYAANNGSATNDSAVSIPFTENGKEKSNINTKLEESENSITRSENSLISDQVDLPKMTAMEHAEERLKNLLKSISGLNNEIRSVIKINNHQHMKGGVENKLIDNKKCLALCDAAIATLGENLKQYETIKDQLERSLEAYVRTQTGKNKQLGVKTPSNEHSSECALDLKRTDSVEEEGAVHFPHSIISKNKQDYKGKKVLLLLGAPGSGKTTLIKLIASFYTGLKSPDEYIMANTKSYIESLIRMSFTSYTAYPDKPDGIAITIIDTPGLSDSSAKKITDTLQDFLKIGDNKGTEIHAVGLVIPAHVSRLTAAEKIVMKWISTHFEEKSTQILPIITFADNNKTPPVVNTLKEFKMSTEKIFLFNNSVLSSDDAEEIYDLDRANWKLGYKNWIKIYSLISAFPALQTLGMNNKRDIGKTPSKDITEERCTVEVGTTLRNKREALHIHLPSSEPPIISGNCHTKHDQSTNTEETMQTGFAIGNSQDESKNDESRYISELNEALYIFVESVDKSHGYNKEWRKLRDAVWEKVSKIYEIRQRFGKPLSCDMLMNAQAKFVLSCKPGKYPVYHYLLILALSESKPLFSILGSLIQSARNTYCVLESYLHDMNIVQRYPFSFHLVRLQNIAKYNALDAIAKAMSRCGVHQ